MPPARSHHPPGTTAWITALSTSRSGTVGHSRNAQPIAPSDEKPNRSTMSNSS